MNMNERLRNLEGFLQSPVTRMVQPPRRASIHSLQDFELRTLEVKR